MSNLKNQILQLLDKNKTYNEIARQLGCGKGTVAYHAKRQNIESVNKNLNKIDNLDWNSIQEYFDAR